MTETEYPPLEDVWMDRASILDRIWVHLNELTINPDTRLYFYCALELRFCIESLFLELLARLKDGKLTSRDLKTYRPTDFVQRLEHVDSDFLTQASDQIGFPITPDDLNRLLKLYGQVGRYLHLPKEPFILTDQEDWKGGLEEFVLNASKYLCDLTGHKWP